ncbi:acyltransferase, partial [Amnimonas aquatica]
GYDIIPFASVGPNETYDIVADADDIRQSRAWNWLDRVAGLDRRLRGGDLIAPVVRGVAGTPLPRPERFYIACGERIPTAHLQCDAPERELQWQVREQTAEAIAALVTTLQAHRAEDRAKWSRLRRWLAS